MVAEVLAKLTFVKEGRMRTQEECQPGWVARHGPRGY